MSDWIEDFYPRLRKPIIEMTQDYDGYFEGIVKRWVAEKTTPFKHRRIVVSAGPWRPYAVAYTKDGDTIHLDFYAALRTGFGELPDDDVARLCEVL